MNKLTKLFLRMVAWWVEYDIAMNRDRLAYLQEQIAFDEARLNYWQIKIMELET